MQQIIIDKTPEVQQLLASLKRRYYLLSEAEIIKMILSEKSLEEEAQKEKAQQAWKYLKVAGKKLGDKMMRDKGLDPKKVTEEEFYNIFLKKKHD